METLERLGLENFHAMRADLEADGIDAGWEETGDIAALLDPHELDGAEEEVEEMRRFGHDAERARPGRDARRGRLADLPRRR